MPYYDHDDFAFTDDGDFVLDFDPLDTGEDVGWDLMMASKYSRNKRRKSIEDSEHPDQDGSSLKEYYLEAMRRVYPGVPDARLMLEVEQWNLNINDRFESLRQTIRERMKTTNEDWPIYPRVGADLEVFVGKNLHPLYVAEIVDAMERSLIYDGLVDPAHLSVNYLEGDDKLALFLVEVLVGQNLTARSVIPFSFVDGPYMMMRGDMINARSIR